MMRRRFLSRVAAVGAAFVVTALLAGGSTASAATAADPSDPYGGSAATKTGEGRFADLSVSVSKTTNLINETVDVSWRWGGDDPGSHATVFGTAYNYNYLAVFQCWGSPDDTEAGPDREQCQYGGRWTNDAGTAPPAPPLNGSWSTSGTAISRNVSPKSIFGQALPQQNDPLEYSSPEGRPADGPDALQNGGVVPMRAAPTEVGAESRVVVSEDTGLLFDSSVTNEVPLARTTNDGTGRTAFEMQTGLESRFLNCGQRLGNTDDGSVLARPCYLVVVPRDSIEVNGQDMSTARNLFLRSSSLSLSNWQNRIVFPLDFLPLRQPCGLGDLELTVVGQEAPAQAVSSWQTSLCQSGLPTFYATVTDDIARSTAAGDLPLLSVVTRPVPEDQAPVRGDLVYAPVALSGVSIAFNIERQYTSNSPASLQAVSGSQAERMNLTPRLVAKLLTQSYRQSVTIQGGIPEHLSDDTRADTLLTDPEFREINDFRLPDGSPDPAFDLNNAQRQFVDFAKIQVPLNGSDALEQTWRWILADEEARAFLEGEPDEAGMVINPFYEGIDNYEDADGPRDDVQRLDDTCVDVPVPNQLTNTLPVCNGDANPYVGSFDDGAANLSRGQPVGGQGVGESSTNLPVLLRDGPQFPGRRGLISLTTTASAERRGLSSASLRNASGEFVSPTVPSMLAAAGSARESEEPGVKDVSPTGVPATGYPLTSYSYAVTNPALLQPAAREDYADIIEYAATEGQEQGIEPGDLPPGYAPLPADDTALAVANAAAIRSYRAPATPAPQPSSSTRPSSTPDSEPVPTPTPESNAGVDAVAPDASNDVPLATDTFPASDQAAVTPDAVVPSVAESAVPVDPGSAPAAATPPSPEPVVLSAGGPRTPSSDVALRLILPIVLGVGILAAAAGGAFLLFGKGGALAAPTLSAASDRSPPSSSSPAAPASG